MPFQLPNDRRGLIVMAKVAEQCERFDEMLACMKRVVQNDAKLTLEEKNLLSVAYKNVLGGRRAPWRTLQALEGKASGNEAQIITTFKDRMEKEIGEICKDIFTLLEKQLIPSSPDDESRVFYWKLKADYHRYYVEVVSPSSSASAEQKTAARESYLKAIDCASSMDKCSPIYLGLLLNLSVFHYEIEKEQQQGYQLAEKAFGEAVGRLEDMNDEDYRESATILALLRDNLNTWAQVLGIQRNEGDADMEVEDC